MLASVLHYNPHLSGSVSPAFLMTAVQCGEQGGSVSVPATYPKPGFPFLRPEILTAIKKLESFVEEDEAYNDAIIALENQHKRNRSIFMSLSGE